MKDRKQYVELNNVKSDLAHITTGVPQGSILGPLLFIMYINDINLKHNDNVDIYIYADDTSAIIKGLTLLLLEVHVQSFLNELNNFFLDNELLINCKKTKIMLFNPPTIDYRMHIYLNNTELEQVDSYKFLGFILDNKLNFNLHSDHLVKKTQYLLFCFKFLQEFPKYKYINHCFQCYRFKPH